MKSAEALLEEADELLTLGEEKIVTDTAAGYQVFQRAMGNLLKAYLITHHQEPLGDLKALFFQCQKLNSEFEAIEDVMAILMEPAPNELDGETVTDAANEVWDFIMEIQPMAEDEL